MANHSRLPVPSGEPSPLDEDYPKTFRDNTARLRQLLSTDTALPHDERKALALWLNDLADKAHDLEDIFQRLLHEPHSAAEIGDLLVAVELTLEQIRGASDQVDGKLYEIGDRLRGVVPEVEAQAGERKLP